PAFHARLIARNALFCVASIASVDPLPAIAGTSGRIAAALGFELKPMPGTLSKGAASGAAVMLYGVSFALTSGIGPSRFVWPRVSDEGGCAAVTTLTFIVIGSVQPAASYG